jgi:hypothetical protein
MDQRINIALYDDSGNPVDATALHLQVLDMGKRLKYEDDYFSPPNPPTRIVKPTATTGQYYINWGDPLEPVNVPIQRESRTVQDLFFIWRAVGGVGTEPSVVLQVVKIVDPIVMSYLPKFRLQIDKAAKLICEEGNIFLGYSDAQLLMYMEGGMNILNTYQPATNIFLENFPQGNLQLLIDTATIVALQSQSLFATDTDLQYQDQGYSFNFDHFPKLQQFMSTLQARIDRLAPLFKLQFATYGSLHIEGGSSYRLSQLLSASPSGTLFRGMWSR